MLFRTCFVLRSKFRAKYLYQCLLAADDNFQGNNVKLAVRHLTKIIKIITLKNMLPIRARIPGSFGRRVNMI